MGFFAFVHLIGKKNLNSKDKWNEIVMSKSILVEVHKQDKIGLEFYRVKQR